MYCIYKTKILKNQEGCVNTLSMECMDFYYRSTIRIHYSHFVNKGYRNIDNMRPDTEETELTIQVAQYLTAITMKMITPVLSLTTSPKGIWYWCSHSKALLVMLPRTLFFLMLWSVLPGSIMFLSCVYMCVCSKFMFIGDDGHMRIFCCGKAVTGIKRLSRRV